MGDEVPHIGMSAMAVCIPAVFLTGVLAGSFIWTVLFLMDLGIDAIWDRVPTYLGSFYPLIVCVIGGLVLGLFTRRFGEYPETLPQVMAKVRENGRYEYRQIGRMSVGAILPLVFGGSVGPEAGLTGIIAAICTWVGDRMRWIGGEVRAITEVGLYATLSAIFTAPLYGLAGIAGKQDGVPRWVRATLYISAIAGAILVMMFLSGHFGGGLSLPRYDRVEYTVEGFLWLIPVCLVGALAGWLFCVSESMFERLSGFFGERCVTKAVVGGVVLGLCGMVLPMTMFSGEMQAEELNEAWMTMSASFLILTGFVKIVVTSMCVNMGWRGGHFFPVIFSGISIGYGLSVLLGLDPVFTVCAVTAAVVGGVTRKPLMSVLLLFLCFPIYNLPILVLAAIIGVCLPRILRGKGDNGSASTE